MSVAPSFAVSLPIGAWHPLLPSALESLAAQKATLEVALLDASNDKRVAQAVGASGLSLTYCRSGADRGQADAIAEGWDNTAADILFWLNADDRLCPGALSAAGNAFTSDPDLAVFFGGSDFIDAAGVVIGTHDQVADIGDLLYRSNTISQPSCFVRRNWVDRIGGLNRRLHYTMDWDLWVRLYAAGAKFQRTEDTLSQVYMGAGTKTERINFQRMLEIGRLVSRHATPWAAVKSVFAFMQHTAAMRSTGQ